MTSSDTYRVKEKETEKDRDRKGKMKLYPSLSTSQYFHVHWQDDEQNKCAVLISPCCLCTLWARVRIYHTGNSLVLGAGRGVPPSQCFTQHKCTVTYRHRLAHKHTCDLWSLHYTRLIDIWSSSNLISYKTENNPSWFTNKPWGDGWMDGVGVFFFLFQFIFSSTYQGLASVPWAGRDLHHC